MLQAIETKFLSATNVRGSRIKATAAAGSIICGYDHSLNSDQNHCRAAETFARKFEWSGHWFGGCIKSGNYVFVLADIHARDGRDQFTIEASVK